MATSAELSERVLSGERLWHWEWPRLLADVEPSFVDRLALAAVRARSVEQRHHFVDCLARCVGAERLQARFAEPMVAEQLVGLLAAEPSVPVGYSDRLPVVQQLETLVRASGATATEAMRRVLGGPVLRDAGLAAGRVGGKALLLELLTPYLAPADEALLAKVWRRPQEPTQARWLAAHRWASPVVAVPTPRVVEAVLELQDVPDFGERDLAVAIVEGCRGQAERCRALVTVLVTRLAVDGQFVDWYARRWLVPLGETAVEPLCEVLRTTTNNQARALVEHALTALEPAALAEEQARQAVVDRGLSRAERPVGDPGRGLSRPD